MVLRVLNAAYWLAILAALGWVFATVIDRSPPISILRETATRSSALGRSIIAVQPWIEFEIRPRDPR